MSIKNLARLLFVCSPCLIPIPLLGELVVNENLGVLPLGSIVKSKALLNSNNNADYHLLVTDKNTILPTNTDREGNWGREYVYQFQINEPSRISLQLTAEGTTADFDFVLFSGKSTDYDAEYDKLIALEGIEFASLDQDEVISGLIDYKSGNDVGDSGIDYTSYLDDPNGKYIFRVTSGLLEDEEREIISQHEGYVTLDSSLAVSVGETYEIINLLPKTNLDGIDPGTYYLVAEVWNGFDGSDPDGDLILGEDEDNNGPYSLRITRSVPDIFDFDMEIGDISTSGEPLFFDTFDSSFDTKLALYGDYDGSTDTLIDLITTNDNAAGTTGSLLSFPNGLDAGKYYLVVGGSDTVFTEGFSGYPSTQAGAFKFRHSRGPNLIPRQIEGTTNAGHPARRVQIIEFSVVFPPPYRISGYPPFEPSYPNPHPLTDLGTIASGLEPFVIDSLGSDLATTGLTDTELTVFDSSGMYVRSNDDASETEFRSELDFPKGLHPGTYWLVLTGFDHQFDHGFSSDIPDYFFSEFYSDGGDWTLTCTSGSHTASESGIFDKEGEQWFRFQVGPNGPEVEIVEITDFQRPTSDLVVITWKSDPGSTYRLETSLEADFWVPVEGSIPADGAPAETTTKVLTNVIEDHRFFRVKEDN